MKPWPLILLAALTAGGCSIAPLPAEPDPVQAAARQEGSLPPADPAQTASCVSLAVPASMVVTRRDGVAVRPAPSARPDYALVLERPGGDTMTWRLLLAETGPDAAAVAQALERALSACATRLGGAA